MNHSKNTHQTIFLLLTFLMMFSCKSIDGQENKYTFEIPESQFDDSPKDQWIKDFATKYNNTENPSGLKFPQDENTNYLEALYREVGPVKYHVEYEGAYWFQGIHSKAWIGIVVRERDGSFYMSGVRRGIRPLNADLPDSISLKQWPEYLVDYFEDLKSNDHYSGSFLFAKDDNLLFKTAIGFSNLNDSIPLENDTKINLASVTKIFTGVAIGQLVQDGKLKFNDPINLYIPEYPEHIGSKVTIHNLLTHTSGIELDNYEPYNNDLAQATSLEEILNVQLKHIENLNSGNYENFEPLNRFDYTNEGIDLLGIIIERVSDISWKEYIQKNIFEKAKMINSGLLDPGSYIHDLSNGYTYNNENLSGYVEKGRREVNYSDASMRFVSQTARPAGSGYSTVEDMYKFSRALQDGTLLNEEILNELTKPQILTLPLGGVNRSYGYTFEIAESKGVRSFGHSGGAPGMSTAFVIYPDQNYTMIALSNYDNASLHVSEHIRELILGQVKKS